MRGIGERARGPHLVLLARSPVGWRSLSRLISRANLAGTKAVPRFRHALLEEEHEGVIALSGCRDGEIARRLRVGDRAGARAVGAALRLDLRAWRRTGDERLLHRARAPPAARRRLARRGVRGPRRGARAAGRRHQRRPLRDPGRPRVPRRPDRDQPRPDARHAGRPPATRCRVVPQVGRRADGAGRRPSTARRRVPGGRGSRRRSSIAASCSVDLEFGQYRFPGFPVPNGETPFSYLTELCWAGARRRYHPLTSAVVKRLAHELDVIERAGLAEFFLICWDLMRFAKEQGIPAQGRGSATSSIVSYTLGISRVEPIAHNLLFERFINPGRTTYPDVDIDFSSERREEVIQYIYRRYGPEHTGMVCNLVTYRARSAVREVGYALGFPRPLVDRVAKALETYDSVMVRRDLEADGGFAEFFRRTGEALPGEARAAEDAEAHGLVDRMGQLNTRIPLVGKVPPWRQPPKPEDPDAPRPFAWLREGSAGHEAEAGAQRPRPRTPPAPLGVALRRRTCTERRPGCSPGTRPRVLVRKVPLTVARRPSSRDRFWCHQKNRQCEGHKRPQAAHATLRGAGSSLLLASAPPIRLVGAETRPATTRLSSARTRSRRSRPSGRAARPTTRVARATPRRASPGCGRVAGPAIRARQARVPPRSRSTRRAA